MYLDSFLKSLSLMREHEAPPPLLIPSERVGREKDTKSEKRFWTKKNPTKEKSAKA
jgi:hypothetical protein